MGQINLGYILEILLTELVGEVNVEVRGKKNQR